MATYTLKAVALGDLIVSGPEPFASNTSTSSDAISARSTITLPSGAEWTELLIDDTDGGATPFEDTDQGLAAPADFNGTSWPSGIDVENEYSYVIRPVGSTDPAEEITIYVLQFDNGSVEGITATAGLQRDVPYEIISGDSSPEASYSDLVICFAEGTRIATPDGPRPVQALRPGDLVETRDAGAQPPAWVGRQVVPGRGAVAPVRIAPGALGNTAPLILSPQHRVLLVADADDILLPVKALIGRPGIARMTVPRIAYHHLLLGAHHVIFAEGAAVESMYPGPMALAALGGLQRAAILALFPDLARGAVWPPARPLVRPGQWRRMTAGATTF
ncbi:Hint domain-containing protein [Rhodovulum marinum]|uniref:Hint domain-containing protein n=1 Tax=Rhodovulum marinum TaxID=320662 RepID=A0A4R2Q544_9RHOB|nr:Hint domain-containing protein [Rhodovulum marinum]TCP41795.1 Hint domain-containing protein [Rhodovulum marinum]